MSRIGSLPTRVVLVGLDEMLTDVRPSVPAEIELYEDGLAWRGEWRAGDPARDCLNALRTLSRDATSLRWNADDYDRTGQHIRMSVVAQRAEWHGVCQHSGIDLWDDRQAARLAERILAFARRWGVLGICQHGLPGIHGGCTPLDAPDGRGASWHWEPLQAWYHYAWQAIAFTELAWALRNNREAPLGFWIAASDFACVGRLLRCEDRSELSIPPDRNPTLLPHRRQQQMLAQQFTAWLILGNIHPALHWDGIQDQPIVTLSLGTSSEQLQDSQLSVGQGYPWPVNMLFPILSAQLATRLSSPTGLARCYICGDAYTPKRKTRHNERHYCSRECAQTAHRQQKQESARLRRAYEARTRQNANIPRPTARS